jgi:hypothetical protein
MTVVIVEAGPLDAWQVAAEFLALGAVSSVCLPARWGWKRFPIVALVAVAAIYAPLAWVDNWVVVRDGPVDILAAIVLSASGFGFFRTILRQLSRRFAPGTNGG